MPKHITSLVPDIYKVVETKGGWDAAVTEFMATGVRELCQYRFEADEEEGERGTLRMSGMGAPCERKLWYTVNTPHEGESLNGSTLLKFLYGDLLEVLLLSLAKAAGHEVAGMQDVLEIAGVKGHRDAVIDGVTVDCKSASPFSFLKFKNGELRKSDPFGYVSQLSSYVYAGHRDDPDGVDEHLGAFLVINKVSGELCLDMYNFREEVEGKEAEFERKKAMVLEDTPPDRGFEDELDGYWDPKSRTKKTNGNKVLGLNCSYCPFKDQCWPGLRTFLYKKGQSTQPKFFTKVAKTPRVTEVT